MKTSFAQRTAARLALAAIAAFYLLPTLRADWPQWRGPDRTELSKETGLLKTWPPDGPKRLWLSKEAGLGYSGPAVVQGKLFTLGVRKDEEQLIAFDVQDGRELWATPMGDPLKNDWGDGPRGTPTVDGGFVYALSGRGTLVCVQVADGKLIWQKSLHDFGGQTPGWGYTESVLVDGNKVVCTPGGKKGALLALDKKTGNTIWQSKEFTDGAQYASIIPAEINGQRQYVQLTTKHFVGIGADDGKLLWSADFPGSTAVIPTPIVQGNQVYVTAGYGAGSKSIKVGPKNELTELYANKVMKNHHGGVILLDGHVYGHSDAGWVCQNFQTGAEVWVEKNALGKGCLTYADGMFVCMSEGNGTVVLIEASPKGWKEHGRFKLDPQTTQRSPKGHIWTHPVVTGGRLYLRDQELLSCYDLKNP